MGLFLPLRRASGESGGREGGTAERERRNGIGICRKSLLKVAAAVGHGRAPKNGPSEPLEVFDSGA